MRNFVSALAVFSVGWLATAASAEGVVVAASGPVAERFPVGTILGPGTALKLRSGESLTVADSTGTRVLIGGKGGERPATAGSSRSAPSLGRPKPGNLWDVDFELGGTWCVLSAEDAQLWLPQPRSSVMLAITSERGTTKQLRWISDAETLAWPGALPIRDGASFVIAAEGKTPTSVTVRVLGERPTSPVEIAQILSDRGCYDQLDQFTIAIGINP